ncbi:hypothetical protein HW132_29355 [Brasilonema sp. CT11]|nr:hypothetical protein [Brasilonema sp. CT11]
MGQDQGWAKSRQNWTTIKKSTCLTSKLCPVWRLIENNRNNLRIRTRQTVKEVPRFVKKMHYGLLEASYLY